MEFIIKSVHENCVRSTSMPYFNFIKCLYYTGRQYHNLQFSENKPDAKIYTNINDCADAYSAVKSHITGIYKLEENEKVTVSIETLNQK